jgi:hypothetical protein
MPWTIARADNGLYPTPPNPAVFPRSSIATVPRNPLATNFPKAIWCDFANASDDLVPQLERLGVTVVTDHNAYANVRAVGSVVGVWDDSRVSTPDGAFYSPNVSGGGAQTAGAVSALHGATQLTILVEATPQPPIVSGFPIYWAYQDALNATGLALRVYSESGGNVSAQFGTGAILPRLRAANSQEAGSRRRQAFVYDGTQATDELRGVFRHSVYDPLTQSWGAMVSPATVVGLAGVPTALITPAGSPKIGIGSLPSTTTGSGAVIGGNGTSVRVWLAALSDAEIALELASDTPVRTADLVQAHDFSGATPWANSGSWGATADLVPQANTVLCSGDRRYAQLASPGTSRPSYVTSGVAPVVSYLGVDDYSRNVSRGQLESITADAMSVHIGTSPQAGANTTISSLSVAAVQGLRTLVTSVGNLRTSTTGPATGAEITPPPVPLSVVFSTRTSNVAGNSIIRVGLGAEVSLAQTPESSGAITRYTVAATGLDTPTQFAPMLTVRRLTLRGVTDANVRQAVAELVSAWAARYAGATV